MKNSINKFFERRRQIENQKQSLKEIPTLACTSKHLRVLNDKDLAKILDSSETHKEWEQAEPGLKSVCQIEDGTTGGVNPGDRRAVWYLIKGFAAKSVLEIGTHVGASTVHIASALQTLAQRNPADGYRLTTVDVEDVNSETSGAWKGYGLKESPREMIRAIGCNEIVSFVTENSLTFLDHAKDRFDFIFLDGDHSATAVYQEIPRALNLLSKDGVILLHDYFPKNRPLWSNGVVIPGPHVAVTRLRREGANIEVIPVGSLPWETKLGSKTTSLALLTRASK